MPPSPPPEHSRNRSFSIDQFSDLITSALDIHRVPDSTLAFSTVIPSHNRSLSSTRRSRNALRKFSSSFFRKDSHQHHPHQQPQTLHASASATRRLASSSVPALSLPQLPSTSTSNSSLDLSFSFPSSLTEPSTPAFPAFDPHPLTGHSYFPTGVHAYSHSHPVQPAATDRSIPGRTPDVDTKHRPSNKFLSAASLNVLRHISKPLKRPFSPVPVRSLSSPHTVTSTVSTDPSESDKSFDSMTSDSGAMRSFFDDSGFAEAENVFPKPTRKSSRAKLNIRTFFSQPAVEVPLIVTQPRLSDVDKPLPSAPPVELPAQEHISAPRARSRTDITFSRERANADASIRPPSQDQDRSRSGSREMTPSLQAVKRRYNPPIFPVPTDPLPPVPHSIASNVNDSAIHLDELFDTDANDVSQSSIDTVEIERWRLPRLEPSTSQTSSSGSSHAHAHGRPSRNSIRERFGLGPRLQVNMRLPEDDEETIRGPKSAPAHIASHSNFRAKIPKGLSIHPPPVPARLPIARLASSSLVSLRSIATITAGNKHQLVSNSDRDDRVQELDVSRGFTSDEDPFAADPPTPITPATPLFYGEFVPGGQRSFMTMGNESNPSLPSPLTPLSAPATPPSWHYRLGAKSNKSSPVLPSTVPAATAIFPFASHMTANQDRLRPSLGRRRDQVQTTPSSPPISCRNLGQMLSRVRKLSGSTSSVGSGTGSADGGRVVGHTPSRPNSPFPLLFLRARTNSKPSPADSTFKYPLPSCSGDAQGIGLGLYSKPTTCKPALSPFTVPLLLRPVHAINEPRRVQSTDDRVHASACKSVNQDQVKKGFDSPTAWLLDGKEYDSESTEYADEKRLAARTLGIDLRTQAASVNNEGADRRSQISPAPPYEEARHDEICEVSVLNQQEQGTAEDGQCWPLPPPRTVVIDDEGESYHTVEQRIDFVRPGTPATSPRHSIQVSSRLSTSPGLSSPLRSISRCSSRSSRRLSAQKATLIAKAMGHDIDIVQESNSCPASPSANVTGYGAQSNTSLVSTYFTPPQTSPIRDEYPSPFVKRPLGAEVFAEEPDSEVFDDCAANITSQDAHLGPKPDSNALENNASTLASAEEGPLPTAC